jgi:Xaa-Pro aminopeptidase
MLDQVAEVSWMEDVRLVSSPDPRSVSRAFDPSVGGEAASRGARSFGAEIELILEANGCGGQPIGIAGMEAMPATLYRDLLDSVRGGIADVPDVVAEIRQLKTRQEIALLTKAASLSDLCYQTMLEVLREGMWGYELTAEMDRTAKRNGADLVYHCMHSAPGGDLQAGKLSIKAHDCRLRRGDYLNLNAYIVYKGYWIQADRAGTIGPVLGRTAARMVEANFSVQDEVLATIRPGLTIAELIRIGNEAARRFGYEIQGGRIGHGQGLDYSERPFLLAESAEVLKPGHVFVLHVCLGIPGKNILLNPIADLCYVTEEGVEVLNRFPRGLFHA